MAKRKAVKEILKNIPTEFHEHIINIYDTTALDAPMRNSSRISSEDARRGNSAQALGHIAEEGHKKIHKVIPALVYGLRSNSEWLKCNSALALSKIKHPDVKNAVEPLINNLEDEAYAVYNPTKIALGRIGKNYPEVIPVIAKALDHQKPAVRKRVLTVLQFTENPSVLKYLIRKLGDKKETKEVKSQAACGLGEIIPPAWSLEQHPDVISPLINALKDKNSDVREEAAESLGKIGKHGHLNLQKAVNPLIALLKKEEIGQNALKQIGDNLLIQDPNPKPGDVHYPFKKIDIEENPEAFLKLHELLQDKKHRNKDENFWNLTAHQLMREN